MPVQQFTSRIVWFVPEGHSAKDETRRHETDLARYADTFEGSKVIEKLTDETAPKAKEIPFRLRDVGYTRAISIVGSELTRQLAERQRRLNREKSRK